MAIVILFVLLFGVVIIFLMRINTNLDIVVRAIPLGTAKIQERRPSTPAYEEQRTRPVGSTTAGSGRHG
jgi:hypothetical protein